MAFSAATRMTAFLAGASLAALALCLDVLKSRGFVPYNADDPKLFPLIAAYFLVTVVVGIQNLFPAELKTRVRFVYFPTTRAAWAVMFNCWGRMLAWFLGGASVVVLAASTRYLAQ